MGQAKQKKQLTPADYHLWSTLESPNLSNTGLWISYSLRYASGNDTLFVRRNDGKKTFAYPLGSKGKFCSEEWFACNNGTDMNLTNLKSGKVEIFKNVMDYEFSSSGKYLFVISKEPNLKKTLAIRNLLNSNMETTENISCWRFNTEKNMLAYCIQKSWGGEGIVIRFEDKFQQITQLNFLENIGTNIVWQNNSSSLVFVLQGVNKSGQLNIIDSKLAQFRISSKRLLMFNPATSEGFSQDKHIESPDAERLKISDDGKRIFFQEVSNEHNDSFNNPLVEVWHGDDKIIYSEQKQYGHFNEWAKTAVWYPDTNEVFEFMPDETHVMLSGNQQFALTSNLDPCELQFLYSPKRDYYLTNLETKERQLFLKCHSPEMHHTLMSPKGKYIVYYKDSNWYSYSIVTGRHQNLTGNLRAAFYDESNDIGDEPDAYGFAGWTTKDESIIIYDRFDMWKVDLNGAGAKRLTKGREKDICFRIARTNSEIKKSFLGVYDGDIINLKNSLTLKATLTDGSMHGFYVFKNGKEEKVHFNEYRLYQLKKAIDTNVYIFLCEDYEHPTSLQFCKGANCKMVYQSNAQHENYYWGKVATINYTGATGKPLKGLLYYPTDYKNWKQYPMVVRVYQKQSDQVHYYINPSNMVTDGFSLINLVNQGYFVLLPDIDYIMGNPGDSAVFCTAAAVNEVLKKGIVNPQKVGLIGHSLGGFESSYIITKSDLFATAVAGAAQTDHVSGYLTVSPNYKKAEFWRYEYFTNRMKKSLFDNFEGYLYNSTVYNAAKIKTPLLLWTGENDRHVVSTQSTELYLAMRRLDKKVTMLRYPGQDHNIENPIAQLDLNSKVMEWFGYYLKDELKKDWMEK